MNSVWPKSSVFEDIQSVLRIGRWSKKRASLNVGHAICMHLLQPDVPSTVYRSNSVCFVFPLRTATIVNNMQVDQPKAVIMVVPKDKAKGDLYWLRSATSLWVCRLRKTAAKGFAGEPLARIVWVNRLFSAPWEDSLKHRTHLLALDGYGVGARWDV